MGMIFSLTPQDRSANEKKLPLSDPFSACQSNVTFLFLVLSEVFF